MRVTPAFRLLYFVSKVILFKNFLHKCLQLFRKFLFLRPEKVTNKCFYEKQITIFGQSAVSYDSL